jgi:hypothetical protein
VPSGLPECFRLLIFICKFELCQTGARAQFFIWNVPLPFSFENSMPSKVLRPKKCAKLGLFLQLPCLFRVIIFMVGHIWKEVGNVDLSVS